MAKNTYDYDITVDYYKLLSIKVEDEKYSKVTIEDIRDGYRRTLQRINESAKKAQNEAEKAKALAEGDAAEKAYDILKNAESKKAYDKARAEAKKKAEEEEAARKKAEEEEKKKRGHKVTNEEEAPEEAKKGNKFLAGIGVGFLIAAIIAASIAGGIHWERHHDKDVARNNTAIEQTIESDNGIVILDGTEAETEEEQKQDESSVAVKNFGNPTDPVALNNRAKEVLTYINTVGAINMRTGLPYTEEDLEKLVSFVNGAYVPTNEADAYALEVDFQNLLCVPLNETAYIDSSIWMANGELMGTYPNNIPVCTECNATDMLLMSDSYSYPYLLWLQAEYNTLTTSSDKNIRVNAFNNIVQSFADIIYGDGVALTAQDGTSTIVTWNDLTSSTRIADGNVFRSYGILVQPFRTELTKEYFTVTTGKNSSQVNIEDIFEQLNVKCANDIAKDVEYSTDGYVVLPDVSDLDNTWDRIQTNTYAYALNNLYYGNTDYFENNQSFGK